MKILFFGTYSREEAYPVNQVLLSGLKRCGVEVIECHADMWSDSGHKIKTALSLFSMFSALIRYISAYLKLTFRFLAIKNYDVIVVGYMGHIDIILAYLLNSVRKKPIYFIALISLYETVVLDRKLAMKGSVKADLVRFIDRLAVRLADKVILDTNENIKYFSKEFGMPAEKGLRLFVGADDTLFNPQPEAGTTKSLRVLFFGSFIPLHGVEYVIEAAEMLKGKEVFFTLIGTGQIHGKIKGYAEKLRLDNVMFINRWVDAEELKKYIADADVCLGIFGTSNKAQKVIPCKVYNALAMGKAVVTGKSKAVEELLEDGEDVLFCRMGSAESLAESLLKIKNDPELRKKIMSGGYEKYQSNCTPEKIAKILLDDIQKNNL